MPNAFYTYTQTLANPKYAPLDRATERKLLAEYEKGSNKAFELLINAHLRFVIWMLRDYKIPNDVDIMDVIQEANIGLLEGIKRFKLTYKCRVYTYCFYWIRFFIGKALTSFAKIHKVFVPIPEDAEYPQDEEETTQTPDDYEQTAKDIVDHALGFLSQKEKTVLILFFGLSFPYEPKTLQEIGSMMHINLERVRQIKDNALKKMKREDLENFL
ncbi:MAG: sigma-70 family RNA polymerase sigma factor [Methanogenium sp.]|jgi:RNA polymerase primary sigma factor